MGFKYIEGAAIADAEILAWGDDLPELFRAAADATMQLMVEELDSIAPHIRHEIHLENSAIDMLLFDFLQTLIYYKDAEQLLLRTSEIAITPAADGYQLTAVVAGEPLDAARHQRGVDVKAVTLHRFVVEQVDGGWRATVILDI